MGVVGAIYNLYYYRSSSCCVLVVYFYPLEIAYCLGDTRDVGKGVVVFVQDALEVYDLMLVDQTDEHLTLVVGICALYCPDGRAVAQLFYDALTDLVSVHGNDLKLYRALAALQYVFVDGTGDEAVDYAQDHRLELEAVDEVGYNGDYCIKSEYYTG